MKHVIVGTAGHIDHGKTALIRALTGTDTDRLKEEQQRGITIDIGFAFLTLANSVELGIIDVPGHEKFVKNMLAGIGGIDLAILVIAADEGVMPQTEEHLAICDLLHIQRGVVALTKTDLVDAEWLELVEEDVRDHLTGTFLRDAPIIPVSSKTRAGLDRLLHALTELTDQVSERSTDGVFRLPIDRVFTIKGFGTVVTGTLISGSVAPDETVQLLPEQIAARVRSVQVHDTPVERAYAGQRTALNLHGVEKRTIRRGDLLSEPHLLTPTYMLDAHLTLLPQAARPLKHRSRVRFHHGAAELMARVVLFDRDELAPGDSAYVQFRLEAPTVALAGDRYIIRSYSPVVTIGGGEILFTQPAKHKRSAPVIEQMQTLHHGSPEEVVTIYVQHAGRQPITPRRIAGMLAAPPAQIEQSLRRLLQAGRVRNTAQDGLAVIHADTYQRLVNQLLAVLEDFHRQFPLKAGIAKEELRKKLPADLPAQVFQQLLDDQSQAGAICVEPTMVRTSSHRLQLSAAQRAIKDQLETAYRAGRFQPPNRKAALEQVDAAAKEREAVFQVLVDEGTLRRVDQELYYHHDVLAEMTEQILAHLRQQREISVGGVKDVFGISRKYAVPLLTYWDATGLTMRKGDVRILRETPK